MNKTYFTSNTDEHAAGEIRPTCDIDMTIRIAYSYSQWAAMQERLAELAFHPDPEGHAMCTKCYNS